LKIIFTDHAVEKIKILREHGVNVTKRSTENALENPDRILTGHAGRQIAETTLDETHVLRVGVYQRARRYDCYYSLSSKER